MVDDSVWSSGKILIPHRCWYLFLFGEVCILNSVFCGPWHFEGPCKVIHPHFNGKPSQGALLSLPTSCYV